jgi:gas vesicle protein
MFHRDGEAGAGFVTGLCAGALFGAGMALLLAPKAGADLRNDIGESVGSLRDAVNRRYQELATRAGVTVENLQDRVIRATEAFEAGARELVQSAQSSARQARTEPMMSARHTDLPRA